MSTDTLHQIAQNDTPAAVHVPKDLNGLIVWAIGRFGGGILLAAACSTVKGEIWWTTSPTVARNHAFVAQLATALGQSDAQIDAIFATAQASAL